MCNKPRSEHHVITVGHGIPLAVSLTGGHRNDVTELMPLLEVSPRAAVGEAARSRGPAAPTSHTLA